MKETRKPSDVDKEKKEEKSKVSPFIQSIKGFVNKLDPDWEPKDKESSDRNPKKNTDSDDLKMVSSNISKPEDDSVKPVSFPSSPAKKEDNSVASPSSREKNENKSEKSEQLMLISFFHQAEEKLSDIIKSDRKRIIRIVGLILAALFIIFGIALLFGSADKVTDNVISGERAVTSAFLIIIGLLLIAGVMAHNIVGKTSFDNLFKEVQVIEGKNSSEDEKNSKTKKEEDYKGNSKDNEDKQ